MKLMMMMMMMMVVMVREEGDECEVRAGCKS